MLIVPNESFGKINFANEENGTGPFTLKSFTSGTGVDGLAYEGYWDGRPPLDELSFAFFADPATASTGLRSGQVDGLYDVAPQNLDAVSDVPNTTVTEEATYAYWWIIQMGKEPLDNPDVRRALRYLFDIDAINNASFRGKGKFSWNPFNLFPGADGPELDDVTYDVDKAKAALAAAGATDITVPILCIAGYDDGIAAAQVLQQSFQDAGITCEVEVAEAARLAQAHLHRRHVGGHHVQRREPAVPEQELLRLPRQPVDDPQRLQGWRRRPRGRRAVPRDLGDAVRRPGDRRPAAAGPAHDPRRRHRLHRSRSHRCRSCCRTTSPV